MRAAKKVVSLAASRDAKKAAKRDVQKAAKRVGMTVVSLALS